MYQYYIILVLTAFLSISLNCSRLFAQKYDNKYKMQASANLFLYIKKKPLGNWNISGNIKLGKSIHAPKCYAWCIKLTGKESNTEVDALIKMINGGNVVGIWFDEHCSCKTIKKIASLNKIKYIRLDTPKITSDKIISDLIKIISKNEDISYIELQSCGKLSHELLLILSNMKSVKCYIFKGMKLLMPNILLQNQGFISFNNVKKLNCLRFNNCEIEACVLKYFPSNINYLELSNCEIIYDDVMRNGFNIYDKDLKCIKRFADLKGLIISEMNIKNQSLNTISDIRSIVELNLAGCKGFTAKGLQYLERLKLLRSLNLASLDTLRDLELDESDMKFIMKLKLLEYLNLQGCYIRDRHLKCLSKLSKLKELVLYGCINITDNGVKHLSNIVSLKKLNLETIPINKMGENHNISDKGLKSLEKLANLNELNLSGCHAITDKSMNTLDNFRYLTVLLLNDCDNITDNGLKFIENLEYLQKLSLQGCDKIRFENLKLNKLSMLKVLELGVSVYGEHINNISNKSLKSIEMLTTIETLNLSGCDNITDDGLKSIVNLIKLKWLNISGCHKITDTGLKYLSNLNSIKVLNIEFCNNISKAGIESLKKSLPCCYIVH